MRKLSRVLSVSVSYAILSVAAFNASAQDVPQPPLIEAIDENGVNFASGEIVRPQLKIAIGASGSSLYSEHTGQGYWFEVAHTYSNSVYLLPYPSGGASGGPIFAHVSYNGRVYRFYVGYWSSYLGNQHYSGGVNYEYGGASQFTCTGTYYYNNTGSCTLTTDDGTVVIYDRSLVADGYAPPESTGKKLIAYATQATKPDGEVIDINYHAVPFVKNVHSSLGWRLNYGADQKSVNTANLSDSYCDFTSVSCSVSSVAPSLAWVSSTLTRNGIAEVSVSSSGAPSAPTITITSPAGRVRTYARSTYSNSQLNHSAWTINANVYGKIWNYNFDQYIGNLDVPNTFTATVTTPLLHSRSLVLGPNSVIKQTTDELGRSNAYTYNFTQVTRATPPGGDANGGYTAYTYDTRYRVKTATERAKSGSGLADQVTTVEYMEPATTPPTWCVNPKTCNKPLWIKDAKGNQIDYTYYAAHGGVETVTLPADVGGVRAKTRNFYTQLYPQIKNASGVLVNSTPVWRLTRTETCASTQTSCNQAGDTVTEYQYVHPNLLMTAKTVRSGDSTISATSSYGYDVVGNTIWVDGPLAGDADRSYATYDVLRRKVFEIGPDPDGAGPLKRQVVKHYYDADSLETRTETGTGNTTNGSDFVWATAIVMTYDGAAQLVKTEVVVP